MKNYRIISGLIILILFTGTLSAQDNNCILRKSFQVKTGNALRLSNKYGDVNVITGSLRIHEINKGFSGIDITSVQARVTLLTGQSGSFLTDININDGQVDFPTEKYPQIIETDSNYSTNFIGIAGPDKQTKSLIKIRATGGRVTVE